MGTNIRIVYSGFDSDSEALIALSAELTAAKMGDVKWRGGMFGVVTASRCCKRFSFRFHIWTARTVQGVVNIYSLHLSDDIS